MDDVVGLRLSLGGASVSPNREPEGGPPADLGGGVAREAEAQATAEADRSIDRSMYGGLSRIDVGRPWTRRGGGPRCEGSRAHRRSAPARVAHGVPNRIGRQRREAAAPGSAVSAQVSERRPCLDGNALRDIGALIPAHPGRVVGHQKLAIWDTRSGSSGLRGCEVAWWDVRRASSSGCH